ncbi:MAG: tetratricopeptide repeat protein [bacterium]
MDAGNTLPPKAAAAVLLAALMSCAALPPRAAGAETGGVGETISRLERAIEENPGDNELKIQLAEVRILYEDYARAGELLEQVIRSEPGNPTALTDLGVVLERTGDPSAALLEQLKALSIDPDHPTASNNLAHTYLSLGIGEKADEYFKKSLVVNLGALISLKGALGIAAGQPPPRLDDDQAALLIFHIENAAFAYLGLGNRARARDLLSEALFIEPENLITRERVERLSRGETVFGDVTPVPLTPEEVDRREQAARALLAGGNFDDSYALLDHLLKNGIESAGIHTAAGVALQARGSAAEAEEHFRRALELDAGHVPALLNLGCARELGGEPREAAALYSRALEVAPDNPMIHNNLGHAYEALGANDRAAEEYSRALELKPNLLIALQNASALYITLGWYERALEALEKAAQIEPSSPAVYNNLAFVHYKRRNYHDALETLDRGIAAASSPDFLRRNRGLIAGLAAREPEKTTEPREKAAAAPGETPAITPSPKQEPGARAPAPPVGDSTRLIAESKAEAFTPTAAPEPEPKARKHEAAVPPPALEIPLPPAHDLGSVDWSQGESPLFVPAPVPGEWRRMREELKGKFFFLSGEGVMWLVEPGGAKRLAFGKAVQPAISRDGARAAYVERNGANLDVVVISTASRTAEKVFSSPEFKISLSFSRDGENIAFIAGRSYEDNHLWVISTDAKAAEILAGSRSVSAYAWRPDGRGLTAVLSECGDPDAPDTNCLVDIDAGSGAAGPARGSFDDVETGIAGGIGGARVAHVDLSPDGGELIVAQQGMTDAVGIFDLRTGTRRRAELVSTTGEPVEGEFPVWSPDGTWLAFVRNGDVWVAERDGSNAFAAVSGYFISGPAEWIE